MKPEERRQLWRERIEAYESSGLSIAEWCRRNEIYPSAFYHWRKRLNEVSPPAPDPGGWLQVSVREETPSSKSHIVVRIGDVTVEVRPDFNPVLLRDVVRALSG